MSEQELTAIAEAQTNLQPGDRLILMELRAIRKLCGMIVDEMAASRVAPVNKPKPQGTGYFRGSKK